MPNNIEPIVQKKFLDAAGLAYFARKLNDYPDNTVLSAVIEGIQDALDEKVDLDQVGTPNGVASLNSDGVIPAAQLPMKYGTSAYWATQTSYIPSEGEIIIYSDRGTVTENNTTVNVPGVKIGDGLAYVVDLPFVGEDQVRALTAIIQMHTSNSDIHVTSEDKAFWNNKLNYSLSGENLVFNRL